MDSILYYVVTAVVLAVIPPALAALGMILRESFRLIRRRLSVEQAKVLDLAAKTAVQFVEQTMATAPDEAKLAEATEKANLYLAAHGIPKLDPNLVRVAVESAVLEVKVQLAQAPGYATPQ